MPKVSILLPTYNRPELLPRAIRSVWSQQYKDWELLVINDGGSEVGHVVEHFKDNRIRYFSIPHGDKSRALNFGIEQAQGAYIAYIDDDDRWYPEHLEATARFLDLNESFIGVYADAVPVKDVGGKRKHRAPGPKHSRNYDPNLLLTRNYIPHLCLVHRIEIFEKTGLYDPDLRVLIDWDMMSRFALAGLLLKHLAVITAEYYIKHNAQDNHIHKSHKSSAMQSNRKLYRSCHKRVKNRIAGYLQRGVDPYGCMPPKE